MLRCVKIIHNAQDGANSSGCVFYCFLNRTEKLPLFIDDHDIIYGAKMLFFAHC